MSYTRKELCKILRINGFTWILVFTLCLSTIQTYALDYPHNSANNMACESCHNVYGSEEYLLIFPEWVIHVPDTIDDTQFNTLCWSCHNDSPADAVFVETHSSRVIDNGGDWAVECRVCHNPHKQQFRAYGSEAYLYKGTGPEVEATTLKEVDADWTVNEYQGYIVVPDIAEDEYNYKILSNTEVVPGKTIVEFYGVVSGNTVRAKHVGRDIMAGLKNLVGGELKGYTELLQESRREATERMVEQARSMGANAVVNLRFATSSVAQGAAELFAYGTAVRVE